MLDLTREYDISGVPVVDGEELVGIVTSRDLRYETRNDHPVPTYEQENRISCSGGPVVKRMIHHTRALIVLSANLYVELALSAITLMPGVRRERVPEL